MLNKQTVIGRFTTTPELRTTANGISVTSFTLACPEDRKLEDGSTPTDFIDCVAWNQTAELIGRYMVKGRLVYVEGRPKTRKYTDKNGVKHKVSELNVYRVEFLDGKADSSNSQSNSDDASYGVEDILIDSGDLPF